ncbi:MAG: helix-turn-helix domain-containing protein [Desulfosalsimonadaceae bacterium]
MIRPLIFFPTIPYIGMKNLSETPDTKWQEFPILQNELGCRLKTEEVAEFLGLDEDTVRKYYREIGGIRPTGPKGRILFFEKNIVSALSRRGTYGFKDMEERTIPMEREDPEGRVDQTKIFRDEKGGTGLGSERKKNGLDTDRHGLFNK